MSSIWERRHAIEKARREKIREVMAGYDKTVYRPALACLREECGRGGHNFKFTDFGPLGHEWYTCTFCGQTKVRDDVATGDS